MTSNLTTSGDISARDVSAPQELHADGAAFLNNTLTVGGAFTLNNILNVRNVVSITAGRGTYGTGGQLNIVGSGDLVYNTSALNFGGNGWSSHCFELSWLGYAHFMRGTSTAAWYQTMTIESTGRWKFTTGLNVVGTCVANVYSTSDSRIKDDVQNIPEQDAINLVKTVSAKTYL